LPTKGLMEILAISSIYFGVSRGVSENGLCDLFGLRLLVCDCTWPPTTFTIKVCEFDLVAVIVACVTTKL
jgi:hypothetical protein